MHRKILTLDDLVKFCETQNFQRFSATQSGYQLCVSAPAKFEQYDSSDTMMFCDVTLMHSGENRNHSSVTEKAAKNCLKTIAYKPVLANFAEFDDGVDFTSHDIEIDDEGNFVYLERQVGCFTADKPTFDDEADDKGRKYVHARVAIPREYTQAAEIIERKNGTKVSVELAVNEMSYAADEHLLYLEDVEVMAVTLLGRNPENGQFVEEGMQGARLDIADFSVKNNSVSIDRNDKLIESLDRLTEQLANFNINPAVGGETKKGGSNLVNKFEELLEKYGKTVDDIDFEYEDLSDEDLEAKFAEVFGEAAGEGEGEPESTPDEDGEKKVEEFDGDDQAEDPAGEPKDETAVTVTEEDVHTALDGVTEEEVIESIENRESDELASVVLDVLNDNDVSAKKSDFAVTYGGNTVNFAVSMSEVLSAMSELVNNTYADSDGDYYSVDVYEADKFVVMQGVWTGKAFRQSYKVRNNVYSLTGDRVPVKAVYVTADEEAELDKMRSNYSLIESKLEKYETEPQKVAILESEDYSNIADVKEFVELKKQENHFDLSVDEVTEKANQILLDYAKHNSIKFSEDEKKNVGMNRLPAGGKKKSSRYGNLFKK